MEVQLIYSAGHSAVQQRDSVIHIHLSILFQIFSHTDYHRILGRGPCPIQQVPVGQSFHIAQCAYANPKQVQFLVFLQVRLYTGGAWNKEVSKEAGHCVCEASPSHVTLFSGTLRKQNNDQRRQMIQYINSTGTGWTAVTVISRLTSLGHPL